MIRVVEADITLSRVDAVINAANSGSFKPMDGGLSGALRNACLPDDVTGVVKRFVSLPVPFCLPPGVPYGDYIVIFLH